MHTLRHRLRVERVHGRVTRPRLNVAMSTPSVKQRDDWVLRKERSVLRGRSHGDHLVPHRTLSLVVLLCEVLIQDKRDTPTRFVEILFCSALIEMSPSALSFAVD